MLEGLKHPEVHQASNTENKTPTYLSNKLTVWCTMLVITTWPQHLERLLAKAQMSPGLSLMVREKQPQILGDLVKW